jgi:hypothetical protein
MVIILVAALVMAAGIGPFVYAYRHRDQILLAVSAVLVLLAVIGLPLLWVEQYLYSKQKGFWYARQMGVSRRRPRPLAAQPPREPLSRELALLREAFGAKWLTRRRLQASLFGAAPRAEPVSRASLLLNVAENLERSGKREAARRCYRQIVQQFSDTEEARQAAERLGPA